MKREEEEEEEEEVNSNTTSKRLIETEASPLKKLTSKLRAN